MIAYLHDKDGHEDADNDDEDFVGGHEEFDSVPYFEADHESSTEDVEDSDHQKPRLQLHPN